MFDHYPDMVQFSEVTGLSSLSLEIVEPVRSRTYLTCTTHISGIYIRATHPPTIVATVTDFESPAEAVPA